MDKFSEPSLEKFLDCKVSFSLYSWRALKFNTLSYVQDLQLKSFNIVHLWRWKCFLKPVQQEFVEIESGLDLACVTTANVKQEETKKLPIALIPR